jgi:hypothetical protein
MKKVFLVLALVATYGVSMAMSGSSEIIADNNQVSIVADVIDNDVNTPEKEKATKKEAKAAKAEGCATAKSEGCGTAKAEGCATAKKAECGDKTKTATAEKK